MYEYYDRRVKIEVTWKNFSILQFISPKGKRVSFRSQSSNIDSAECDSVDQLRTRLAYIGLELADGKSIWPGPFRAKYVCISLLWFTR